jgi:predicted SAM-dependent methyltransferase
MRFNLGCGNAKRSGWVNVDKIATCTPDQVVDLEKLPWPWPDNSAEEVVLSHVLEHLGATTELYLGIIKELYRVCRDGAMVTVTVPHPRHDHFLFDPTHVRAVTAEGLQMFSQKLNRDWMSQGFANTPLGVYVGVDFDLESASLMLDDYWRRKLERKQITQAELELALRNSNNVVQETTIVLKAVKPAGRVS